MSRAARSAPILRQPELLALLEAQARLRAQRIAEGGPADADRVEDRRLDHDLAGRVPTSDAAPPMTPAMPDRALRVGDEQRLGVELAVDVVERLEALARPRRAGRRSGRRAPPPRRTCGSACPARP